MPRERWQMSAVAEADSRLAMQLAISFLAPAGERSSRQRASKRTCPLHIFLSFFFSVSVNEQPSPAALIAGFLFLKLPDAMPIRSPEASAARAINELMPLSNHAADCTRSRQSRGYLAVPSSGSFSSRQLRPLSSRVKTYEIIRCITLRALRFRVTETSERRHRRMIISPSLSLSLSLSSFFSVGKSLRRGICKSHSRMENQRAQQGDSGRFV